MMYREQVTNLHDVLELINRIDDSDDGQVAFRVARRKLAEVLGLPVKDYMLLMDTLETVKPIYCKSSYC